MIRCPQRNPSVLPLYAALPAQHLKTEAPSLLVRLSTEVFKNPDTVHDCAHKCLHVVTVSVYSLSLISGEEHESAMLVFFNLREKGRSLRAVIASSTNMPKCPKCNKEVYFAEKVTSMGKDYHRPCLKCEKCNKTLSAGSHAVHDDKPYCHNPCYSALNELALTPSDRRNSVNLWSSRKTPSCDVIVPLRLLWSRWIRELQILERLRLHSKQRK
ncbi:Cysteine-rich 1 [Solea senegalensis]|uniref:Cysteine-rich 1 n=1 Tax=Solea senegalensis TaxID=28829 RepID=A0AAV6S0K1_SOLSE|nr:Cysteine-rich 1 [Solea senegalensis]